MDVNHLKFLPTDSLNNSSNLNLEIQTTKDLCPPLENSFSHNLDAIDLLNANLKPIQQQQPVVEGRKMLPDDLIETVENLADITLIGSIIRLLRSRGNMHFTDIIHEISKFYHNLRRADGSKYEGNISKAVRGCLTSSKIFYSAGEDIWSIQDQQAQIYERNTTQKVKALLTKKRTKVGRKPKEDSIEANSNQDLKKKLNSADDESEIKTRKKAKRSSEKYQQMYDLLNNCSKALKANDGTAHLIQSPFKGLKGNENMHEIWQKIGSDRFVGMMQCFEYFSPIIEEHLKKQNIDSEKNKPVSLENIKMDLSNLYKNVLLFEKGLPQKDLK